MPPQRTLSTSVALLCSLSLSLIALETYRLEKGSPVEPENAEAEQENRKILADARGLPGHTDVGLGIGAEDWGGNSPFESKESRSTWRSERCQGLGPSQQNKAKVSKKKATTTNPRGWERGWTLQGSVIKAVASASYELHLREKHRTRACHLVQGCAANPEVSVKQLSEKEDTCGAYTHEAVWW